MDLALTFAYMARNAFVAVSLLRSLERKLIDEGISCFDMERGIGHQNDERLSASRLENRSGLQRRAGADHRHCGPMSGQKRVGTSLKG